MDLLIPEKAKELWSTWNLRAYLVSSLSLQTFLLVFASFRKRTPNKPLVLCIWSAYLLANWVAFAALGLIFATQGSVSGPDDTGDLSAFWATFFLLHVGGPDNITSFAQEDNELWLRFVFGLISALLSMGYICIRTIHNNILWLPTVLMFVAGAIKYFERAKALYLASVDNFRDNLCPKPNSGPDYGKMSEIYSWMSKANLPTFVQRLEAPEKKLQYRNGMQVVTDRLLNDQLLFQQVLGFFETFKGLIVEILPGSTYRNESRNFFLKLKSKEAFRLIEIELSFVHDVLHTKAVVIRQGMHYFLRVVSICCVMGAVLSFFLLEKQRFHRFDVVLAYALFIGAWGHDALSVLMLIFSDWTSAAAPVSRWRKFVASIVIHKHRWSNCVDQCNLITYSLNQPSSWVQSLGNFLNCEGLLDNIIIATRVASSKRVTKQLKKFVFTELQKKSLEAEDIEIATEICSKRGDWVLEKEDRSCYVLLKWSLGEVPYAESLLLWHIATELCYQTISSGSPERGFCKILSDYMFYLLLQQPDIVTQESGNWQKILEDTREDAETFFCRSSTPNDLKAACERILSVNTEIIPGAVKDGRTKTVLFDASILANQLLSAEDVPWKLMSQVWVELVCYAAINCRADIHVQQPSRGGELVTCIWLLMTHLGLAKEFTKDTDEPTISKFVVQK